MYLTAFTDGTYMEKMEDKTIIAIRKLLFPILNLIYTLSLNENIFSSHH